MEEVGIMSLLRAAQEYNGNEDIVNFLVLCLHIFVLIRTSSWLFKARARPHEWLPRAVGPFNRTFQRRRHPTQDVRAMEIVIVAEDPDEPRRPLPHDIP